MKKLFILIICVSLILPILGQDTLIQINAVKVFADRIINTLKKEGKSVQIISRKQIKSIPAQSIAGILVHFTGVDIRQRGANGVQADIGLRGSTFDQVLVLINGVRMTDAQTGHHTMNLPIDVSVIKQIEIIKGAGARVYGQNAFAGVINIITINPKQNTLKLSLKGGDFNLGSIAAMGTLSTKKTKQLLSMSHTLSDGYKFNTDYKITKLFYTNQFKISNTKKIEFMAGYTDKKFGANGFYSSPAFVDQYEETETSIVSAKYKIAFKNNNKLSVGTYWRKNKDMYVFLRHNPSFFKNKHVGNNIGININSLINSKIGQTGLGIDVSKFEIESNNLGNRERYLSTVFAEHKLNLFKNKLHLTPGIQWVYSTDYNSILLPGIDANYEVLSFLSVFANSGKTYRTPTYTDLYYQGRTNIGNDQLVPEIALSHELGVKFNNFGVQTQASYFYRNGVNIIDWTKDNVTNPWKPTNLTTVNMHGLDFNMRIDYRRLFRKNNGIVQFINIGYTKLTAESLTNTITTSKYAYEYLNNQITASIVFNYIPNLSHSILIRYADRVNLDDYYVLDSKLQYDNRKWQFFGEISNILAAEYKETNLVEMPGRWLKLGVGYTFTKK